MNKLTNLYIEADRKSPQIDFNHLLGELILYGRSIPENAAKVYQPLINWTHEYIKSPKKVTNFRLNLEYFNTASIIWIAKIIKVLCKIENPDYILYIHLYFDKEDYEEMGSEDLRGFIDSLIGGVPDIKVNMMLIAYGKDENGDIANQAMILLES